MQIPLLSIRVIVRESVCISERERVIVYCDQRQVFSFYNQLMQQLYFLQENNIQVSITFAWRERICWLHMRLQSERSEAASVNLRSGLWVGWKEVMLWESVWMSVKEENDIPVDILPEFSAVCQRNGWLSYRGAARLVITGGKGNNSNSK